MMHHYFRRSAACMNMIWWAVSWLYWEIDWVAFIMQHSRRRAAWLVRPTALIFSAHCTGLHTKPAYASALWHLFYAQYQTTQVYRPLADTATSSSAIYLHLNITNTFFDAPIISAIWYILRMPPMNINRFSDDDKILIIILLLPRGLCIDWLIDDKLHAMGRRFIYATIRPHRRRCH